MNITNIDNNIITFEDNSTEEATNTSYDVCNFISASIRLSDDTKSDIDKMLESNYTIGDFILNILSDINDCAAAYNAVRPYTEVVNVILKSFSDKSEFVSEVQTMGIRYDTEYYPDGDEYFMIVCELMSDVNGPLLWVETFVTTHYYEGSSTTIYKNFLYCKDEF